MDIKTHVSPTVTVSTIEHHAVHTGWAMFDRGHTPEHRYETLVFRDGTPDDFTRREYDTAEAAEAGHKAAVEREVAGAVLDS